MILFLLQALLVILSGLMGVAGFAYGYAKGFDAGSDNERNFNNRRIVLLTRSRRNTRISRR